MKYTFLFSLTCTPRAFRISVCWCCLSHWKHPMIPKEVAILFLTQSPSLWGTTPWWYVAGYGSPGLCSRHHFPASRSHQPHYSVWGVSAASPRLCCNGRCIPRMHLCVEQGILYWIIAVQLVISGGDLDVLHATMLLTSLTTGVFCVASYVFIWDRLLPQFSFFLLSS